MDELVLIKPIGSRLEPYTTADVVAEYAGIKHKTVNRLIQQHEKDLEDFGLLRFEMEAVERTRGIKYQKKYYLNEQQATLLITYLKNTEPVRAFKKCLVREFFKARQELAKREAQRAVKAPIRHSLTDAIRDSGENERMHGQAFSTYTNLIYKTAIGKSAKQLRRENGLPPHSNVVALLTSQELSEVTRREAQVCTLLDCGMRYEGIKAVLLRKEEAA